MIRYLLLCCFVTVSVVTSSVVVAEDPLPPNATTRALSPHEQEIHEFFDRYQTASLAESPEALCGLFDFEQIAKDVAIQSGVNFPLALQQQVATVMRTQFVQQLQALDAGWTRHRIMRIEFLNDQSVADVYVRSWANDVGTSREMYVLKQIAGEWRICDFSELSLGISTVSLTAMGLRESIESSNANEMLHGLQSLTRCVLACQQGDTYEAAQEIDGVLGYAIPESMQSLRWKLAAAAHSDTDPAITIEMLDKAAAFDNNAPLADYLRGSAYLELGRYEQSVKHYRVYLNQFGDDADAYYGLGLALEELGRTDEAIAAYQAALLDTPESIVNLQALASVLPDERKQEIAPYFRALPDPESALEELGDACLYPEDVEALDAVVNTATALDPEMKLLGYYHAMLKHLRGDHEAAYQQLAVIIQQRIADDDVVDWQEVSLCDVARHGNKVMEAYELCSDKSYAISNLISRTDNEGKPLENAASDETIETLVQRFLTEHDSSFDALYQVATSYFYNSQQYELAQKYFVAAIAAAEDDEQRADAMAECVMCYVALERPLDAYTDLDSKELVLDALEYEVDDEATMAELLKRHRETYPDSPRFLWTDLPELFDKKQYQAGLDRLAAADKAEQAADDGNSNDDGEGNFETDWRNTYRTRFLIGLKRFDDAMIAAHSASESSRDFLRALVYAAKGNRGQFLAAYARCLASDGYYDAIDFQDAPEVPQDWLPDASPENPDVSQQSYDAWDQVRRVVFLLPQPRRVDVQRVIAASQAIGEPLFAIDREQMTAEEDDYVFQANKYCVMISTQKCRYFVHWGEGPFLHDAELLSSELEVDDELADLIKQHTGWLAIEIFQWPQNVEQEEARSIPLSASKRMAEFARQLVGDVVSVAIHADNQIAVVADNEFFERLAVEPPIAAF